MLGIFRRHIGKRYEGDVVFIDGCHYPARNGVADMKRPLRWQDDLEETPADDAGFYFKAANEPTHQHLYERRIAEIKPKEE